MKQKKKGKKGRKEKRQEKRKKESTPNSGIVEIKRHVKTQILKDQKKRSN